jgi:hypothetical protein
VVTGSSGRTALEVETGTRVGVVEVELRTGIDMVEVEAATGTGAVKVEAVATGVSGTAIEVEEVSETGAADAVLLAKCLSVWALCELVSWTRFILTMNINAEGVHIVLESLV